MFALASASSPAFSATRSSVTSSGEPVLFAFTGGGYDGYKTWRWSAITHLGFWTAPSGEVRSLARQHGVKLFHNCETTDPKDWTDGDKRKKVVQSCVADVQQHQYDGVFFDFEGNGLKDDQKEAYTGLAQEMTAALQPLNATLAVCVGGRPAYELRNYDYAGLAAAVDFLFVMGYDLHLYDDYTCEHTAEGNVCSPAEASIRSLKAGVAEYLKVPVPADKLVLGLPWYGQRYNQIVAPINEGQIDYKEVLAAFDRKIVTKHEKDHDSLSWKIDCSKDCLDGKSGKTVYYDDAETLAPKYALAAANALRGVGMWKVDDLPAAAADGSDPHEAERTAMWDAIQDWRARRSDA